MKKILLLSTLAVSLLTVTAQAQTPTPVSSQKEEILLYPNPARNAEPVSIKSTTGFIPQSIQLINSAGKPLDIFSTSTFTNQSTMLLPKLSAGAYFLSFLNKDKKRETKKLVVMY